MTDQIKVQSTFIVYTFPYKNNNCTLAIKKTNTSLSLNGLTYAWLILIFLLVENSLCEKKIKLKGQQLANKNPPFQ